MQRCTFCECCIQLFKWAIKGSIHISETNFNCTQENINWKEPVGISYENNQSTKDKVFDLPRFYRKFLPNSFQAINAVTLWQRLKYRAANWISFSEIKSIFHPSHIYSPSQKTPWENSREFLFTITFNSMRVCMNMRSKNWIFFCFKEKSLSVLSWYLEIIWRTQG